MRNEKAILKMADQDAANWARAQMSYGKGSGTRRRLLQAEITTKVGSIPGYSEAFEEAYSSQNMDQHAKAAIRNRRRMDNRESLQRNLRGILTGNTRGMTNTAITGVLVYVILKETGHENVVKAEIQKRYSQAKSFVNEKTGMNL